MVSRKYPHGWLPLDLHSHHPWTWELVSFPSACLRDHEMGSYSLPMASSQQKTHTYTHTHTHTHTHLDRFLVSTLTSFPATPALLTGPGELLPYPAAAAKSLQSYPTLCDPIDGSPPGSPVPGILQARTLEWVAISFSNA